MRIDYSSIMTECTSRNKLKTGNMKVDVVYNVFKNTQRYISPELIKACSKTALDIAYYICTTINVNQTSIKLVCSDIIKSDRVKTKTPCAIYNAINELVKLGVIVKWKDIEDIPNTINIGQNWYLINPQMIKTISCKAFEEQVNTTVRQLTNSSNYTINEYSAIVYDF